MLTADKKHTYSYSVVTPLLQSLLWLPTADSTECQLLGLAFKALHQLHLLVLSHMLLGLLPS